MTTTKGVLPDATSGISNWNTVPAGTVANWDQTPEINKVGTSYGTVYVTFPDGSRSRLAVYVTVKDTAAQDSKTNKSNVKSSSSTTVTEKNVSVVNNSKDNKKNSKKTSNPVSVATQLPETEGKAVNPLVVIGGLLVAAISAVAIFGKKIKNRL